MHNDSDYHYVIDNFLQKVGSISTALPFIRDAIAMYKLLKDPYADWTYKTIVIGALAYFILPVDMIPDTIPVAGYLDDASVVATARALLDCVLDPYM